MIFLKVEKCEFCGKNIFRYKKTPVFVNIAQKIHKKFCSKPCKRRWIDGNLKRKN